MRKVTSNLRTKVLVRDNYTCQYCGSSAEVVDHIVPYSYLQKDGGINNLVSSCSICNLIVSDNVFPSFDKKKEFILGKRSRRRSKRLKDNRNICPDCKRSFKSGKSTLLCDECYEFWTD